MPRRKVSPVVRFIAFANSSRAVSMFFVVLACVLAGRVAAEEPAPKQGFVMPQRSDRPMNSLRKKPNVGAQNKEKTNASEKPSGKLSYLPTEDPGRDKEPVPARPNSNDVTRRAALKPQKAIPQSPKYAASASPRSKVGHPQIAEPRAVASQPILPGPKASFSDRIDAELPSAPVTQRSAIVSSRTELPSVADTRTQRSLEEDEAQPSVREIAESQIPVTRPIAPPIQREIEEIESTEMPPRSAEGIVRSTSNNIARRAAPVRSEEKFFPDDESFEESQTQAAPSSVASRNAVHEVELNFEDSHPVQREPARRSQHVADDPFEMPIRIPESPELPDDSSEEAIVSVPLQKPLVDSKELTSPQTSRNVAQRFFEDEPAEEESDEVMELVDQPKPAARRHSMVTPDDDDREAVATVVQALQEVESSEAPMPEPAGPSKDVLSQLKPVRTIELRKAVEVVPLAEGDNPQLKEPVDQAKVVLARRLPFHFWPIYRDPWSANRDSYPFSHYPLWFEDPNMERCGRGFGHFTTAVSVVRFAANIPILPYRITAEPPCRCVRTLPDCTVCEKFGCEVYLPPWSWSAAAVQAAATVGCIYVIP